jgi:hypothetical protein
MPATPFLNLDEITQGQYQKEVTANMMVEGVESALCSEAEKAVGGAANVTLTDAESRHMVLRLTGVLTGNIELRVPTRDKLYVIHNATTGAYTVTVKTTAGTGVVAEQGFKTIVYCDATNVLPLTGTPLEPYRTATGSVTARITDRVMFCDATGGNVTITLPAANTAQGWRCRFIRVDSSANTVTIQRAGADDINNAATSKTIVNTIGTALEVTGYNTSRFMAQTLTAA